MMGKLPEQMENVVTSSKTEMNFNHQYSNRMKSGKKHKKQSQADYINNNKYTSKGLDDDHNRINLENV